MRIGLFTFHRANNVGAVLQAYALCEYINTKFCNAEIVDYLPNSKQYKKTLRKTFIYNILRYLKNIIRHKDFLKRNKIQEKFDDFRTEKYKISHEKYVGDLEIEQAPPQYTLYISGSDQILNTTLSNNSSAYYLRFAPPHKRVSYASSFGRTDLTDLEHKLIRSELSQFVALSCREKSGVDIIRKSIGLSPTLVVDPVFLISKNEWTSSFNTERKIKDKYIFIYSMESTADMEAVAAATKSIYNLPFVHVDSSCNIQSNIKGFDEDCCGPIDWLNYLYNADVIVTNSFHGTAFSLIFGKLFYTVKHSTRSTRLESLLSLVNKRESLISDFIGSDKLELFKIDGATSYPLLSSMILDSQNYLKFALKSTAVS